MWTPSGKLGESGLLRVAQMWSDVYSAPHHPGVTVERPKAKGAGGGVSLGISQRPVHTQPQPWRGVGAMCRSLSPEHNSAGHW